MRGVLIVDKAEGPSSHDVVRVARRVFKTRAIGHAGTLDPMASGVLVLGIGEGTKLLAHLSAVAKVYTGVLRLGVETDSLDAQGSAIEEGPVPEGLNREGVQAIADRFLGETLQRAPVISAIKQAGMPLYARVRRGEVVVAPERSVFVHALEIEQVEAGAIGFRVHCAKGFYVRALARDLARALGTCGHLTRLRRVASGAFEVSVAIGFDTLVAASRGETAAREAVLQHTLSLPAALASFTQLTVTLEGAEDIRHGRAVVQERIAVGEIPAAGVEPIALLDADGELLALGRAEEARVRILRGIVPSRPAGLLSQSR
jgi:tRNA pseudouridine55 synthase